MDLQALIIAIVGAVLAFAASIFLEKWRVRRQVTKMAAQFKKSRPAHPGRSPENTIVVELRESGLVYRGPGGAVVSLEWSDLRAVELVTTDAGPFAPDVFWILHGSEAGCVIPQGATGEPELFERLQALPGFRNDLVIDAMGSTANRRFRCWERP